MPQKSKIPDRIFNAGENRRARIFNIEIERVNAFEPELQLEDDNELCARFQEIAEEVRTITDIDEQWKCCISYRPEVFAIVREASVRSLGMRHFDVQLYGAMTLTEGCIAEMKTGEGKTLMSTLSICLIAMCGRGVHVVTVNEYLAQRDAQWMGPIYALLGLTFSANTSEMEAAEKQRAFACDVTYSTNSEIGFDWLRDNMAVASDDTVLRAPFFALIDEVDNILIDEARTPLVISGAPLEAADEYSRFVQLAASMQRGSKPEGGKFGGVGKDWQADYDYEVDEKSYTVSISEQGVEKAEEFLGLDHLYRADHGHLVNLLHQAIKAESLYQRDVDYAVIDGQVHIIDEYTGRILEGRRWSDGLHQAIEAKEGVAVGEENQTLATITYQNLFRMYPHLAGMTGTAMTEAIEFTKIYQLDVIAVPTNKTVQRVDDADVLFRTEKSKFTAVLQETLSRHEKGQPILIGTTDVDTSERLSAFLTEAGIKHQTLNAKPEHSTRESIVIADAGRLGAVTIATNMAGRGVDIKLGGEQERRIKEEKSLLDLPVDEVAEEALIQRVTHQWQIEVERCRELGGLAVIGTARHESRRIDNQLRGRSGRQGDPGWSRFYVSTEDELLRLFGGDKIGGLLERFVPLATDGSERSISHPMLSKQIEKAQQQVEERNFLQRKNVLDYDDVANQQRGVIYGIRRAVLTLEQGKTDVRERLYRELDGVLDRCIEAHYPGDFIEDWDRDGLFVELTDILGLEEYAGEDEDKVALREDLHEWAINRHRQRIEKYEDDFMLRMEAQVLLYSIDQHWREHLADMDYLREGINLRAIAEIDPLIAYKGEAFTLFEHMFSDIWKQAWRMVLRGEPLTAEQEREIISDDELAEKKQRRRAMRKRKLASARLDADNVGKV